MCEKHALLEAAGDPQVWTLIVRATYALTAPASSNNNASPMCCRCFAGVSEASVLALQGPLLMKVLWLDSGEVESRL